MFYIPGGEELKCEYPKCTKNATIKVFNSNDESISLCRSCRNAVVFNLEHIGTFYPGYVTKIQQPTIKLVKKRG